MCNVLIVLFNGFQSGIIGFQISILRYSRNIFLRTLTISLYQSPNCYYFFALKLCFNLFSVCLFVCLFICSFVCLPVVVVVVVS